MRKFRGFDNGTGIQESLDDRGGDGTGCFEIKVGTDTTTKFTNMRTYLDRAEVWFEKVRCSSKIKPRLRAE